jgi:hypothetical protein
LIFLQGYINVTEELLGDGTWFNYEPVFTGINATTANQVGAPRFGVHGASTGKYTSACHLVGVNGGIGRQNAPGIPSAMKPANVFK